MLPIRLNKGLIAKIALSLALVLFITAVCTVKISTDKSLPYTIWISKRIQHTYKKGEYVLIRYNNIKLIKQIKCLPGDELYTINDCFYCNAEMLGCAKLFDRKGNFTTPFYYNG
ncbi:MAG: S26 family signal peptidase, partial [Deferribacteraceae bacterium]|nr:S26 family signal peptidase [Deferribacteraceae bacterium]